MSRLTMNAVDARQSLAWGSFLQGIGWNVERIDGVFLFVRMIPFLKRTIIKIQHPKGPLPLEKIEAFARKQSALFCVIEPHIDGFSTDNFIQNGYQVSRIRFAHSATILIDLEQPEKQLLHTFSENARRNIKKAKAQLTVKIVSLKVPKYIDHIREFYLLYQQLGKEKRFYVPSYDETKKKMEAFRSSSYLLYAYEQNNSKPVAVLWVGSVEKTMIYFHPGNTKRGYVLLANYLLVWEAMKLGKKIGMKVFDFETAYDSRYAHENKKWKGYTEFKNKFGGEMVLYPPSFIKFYHPVAEIVYRLGTLLSH